MDYTAKLLLSSTLVSLFVFGIMGLMLNIDADANHARVMRCYKEMESQYYTADDLVKLCGELKK